MKTSDLFESRSILFESGDNPYPWTLDFNTPTLYTYVFQPNPDYDFKYEVRLTKSWGIPEFTNHWWNIDFGAFGHYTSMNNIDPYDLNGLAQDGIVSSIRVFGTVAHIIQDFLNKESVPGVEFTAVDAKRIDLYSRMLPRLARKCNMSYEIRETNPTGRGQTRWLYRLIKKQLDESVRMDGFWITTLEDLPMIFTDHTYNIHHEEIANEWFTKSPGAPRPMEQALEAGWIRVNVARGQISIQCYPDMVPPRSIRKLLDFIKDYRDRNFFWDDKSLNSKYNLIKYNDMRQILTDVLKTNTY